MAIAKGPAKKTPSKRDGPFKKALNLTWVQFTSTTTIHGLQHVNDVRGTKRSRAFWIFIPIFCFLCALLLMMTFLIRYKSNPTRINVETNFAPISEIEFPAVTFCNPNFIMDSQVQALADSLDMENVESKQNISKADLHRMIKYAAGFTNPINKFDASELPLLQEILQANRFNVELAMKKLMYPCSKMLHRCRWEGVIVDCRQYFQTSETYQGYCCSFNVLKPTTATGKTQKIRKTQYFGPERGLSVILSPKIEKNAMTSVNSEGMKILINQFNLYPSERSLERMCPHMQESYVEIRPERTDCSAAVKALPISDRGCVFEDETQLKYFPKYSEENCRVECNMDLHIKTCDCLPYYFYNTDNIETCSFTNIACMVKNRDLLRNLKKTDKNDNSTETCTCPSQCFGQTYDIRISSTGINTDMKESIDPFRSGLTSNHMIVHVYFVSQNYRVFSRTLLTNFIALVSNLGGVYSLLIGMSVLSLIEILYFFTIRLYENYKMIKTEDSKPKTFSQRIEKITTITQLKVPRLNTARASTTDSSVRMTALSHY